MWVYDKVANSVTKSLFGLILDTFVSSTHVYPYPLNNIVFPSFFIPYDKVTSNKQDLVIRTIFVECTVGGIQKCPTR